MKTQWIRWLPFLVVAVELVLYLSGVLSLAQAAILLVVLEGLLTVVVLGQFALLARAYHKAQRDGVGRAEALARALDAVLPRPVAFLVGQEIRILAAAVGGLLRRRSVPATERVITYSGRLNPLLIVMVVVSVVEFAVVEYFVPWTWARWALLIVGVYGLIWVAGFAGAMYTRPHGVGDDALHLRFATFADVAVPLDTLVNAGESIGSHNRNVDVTDGVLAVSVMGLTNVTLTFEPPVRADLGTRGVHAVGRVRFYADDPATATALLRGRRSGETRGSERRAA